MEESIYILTGLRNSRGGSGFIYRTIPWNYHEFTCNLIVGDRKCLEKIVHVGMIRMFSELEQPDFRTSQIET